MLRAPIMAAMFISAPLYFRCFLLALAFSLSRATHPSSLMVYGCDMSFLKVCTGLLHGCGNNNIFYLNTSRVSKLI